MGRANIVVAATCFNGAMRVNAWKFRNVPSLSLICMCFNGAMRVNAWKYDLALRAVDRPVASMEPCVLTHGNFITPDAVGNRPARLQWSHAC